MNREVTFNSKGDQGVSLVTVMVAIGILGILVVQMSQYLSNLNASSNSLREKAELEELRQNIRARLSCVNTVAAMSATCSSGTAIKTFDQGNQVAFTTPYQKIGRYYLHAVCTGAPFQLDYEYSMNTGGPWKILFPKVPIKCY